MRRFLPFAVWLAIAVAACGGSSDATTSGVVDFAEIAVAEPTLSFDASATTARLDVETTITAVCSVAYGETEALGSLTTDQDMEAGGHRDHGPLLTGLEPETVYFYRLQGTGPDGTLYQSELLTFTTPPAEDLSASPNLALGATVTDVSSEFSDGFIAANAIDGNPATEWSTAGDGDDAHITIDLGVATPISSLRFVTRQMGDGSSITTTFTVTIDDGAVLGPFTAGLDPPLTTVDTTGRVLRFEVETSTGGNTGAVEIEIFGR
jgi:hypothetical protein